MGFAKGCRSGLVVRDRFRQHLERRRKEGRRPEGRRQSFQVGSRNRLRICLQPQPGNCTLTRGGIPGVTSTTVPTPNFLCRTCMPRCGSVLSSVPSEVSTYGSVELRVCWLGRLL